MLDCACFRSQGELPDADGRPAVGGGGGCAQRQRQRWRAEPAADPRRRMAQAHWSRLMQCWPEKNLKGPHSICAKNSSIQNVWKILEPKGPVGPAGGVMANTAV